MNRKQFFTLFTFCMMALPCLAANAQVEKPLRPYQISLVPFIGTDGSESINYRYERSFNLLGGITGGLEGYELGGLLNITHGEVYGLQLSGFANIVSDEIYGLQGAGFINVNAGDFTGLRGAGFMNVNSGEFSGLQGAGFINISGGEAEGFSGAGFANITGGEYLGFAGAGFANISGSDITGFAGAGFANISGGMQQGFAGAGFGNISGGGSQGFSGAGFGNLSGGEVTGFQGAGFGNMAQGAMTGLQLAGFMNVSRDLQGAQIAGFLNIARSMEGVQLGVINLADTVTGGTPIGFLSIVRRGGLRQAEIAASDAAHMAVAFRIGTPTFYNIFSYNARSFSSPHFNVFGYGFGSRFLLTDHVVFYPEIHSMQLQQDFLNWDEEEVDILSEIRLNFAYRISDKVEWFAGAVLYHHLYKDNPGTDFTGSDIAPGRKIYEDSWGSFESIFWPGFRMGIYVNMGNWY